MPGPAGPSSPHHPDTCHERIAELEVLVEQLRDAAASREHVGFACGVLAERYELAPTTAWSLLQRLSQNTNVKVREVARLMRADLDGGIPVEDAGTAQMINEQVAAARPLFTDDVVGQCADHT